MNKLPVAIAEALLTLVVAVAAEAIRVYLRSRLICAKWRK